MCVGLNALGFTNRSLRAQVSRLFGAAYTVKSRHQHLRVLTSDGQRVAIFYTKLHNRLLRPLIAATPPHHWNYGPRSVPSTSTFDGYFGRARLKNAAA